MKALAIVKLVFALVGTALLTGTWFAYKGTREFLQHAERTTGVVINMTTSRSRQGESPTYRPTVRFTSKSGVPIEFASSVSSNPPSHTVGEEVEVLYVPDQPHDARIADFFSLWGLTAILGGMASVFVLVAGGIAAGAFLHRRQIAYLRQHGQPIDTVLLNTGLNSNITVNGQHPYRVSSQWQDPQTSKVHVFTSENIWFNPTDYIKTRTIRVFIAPGNPRKYHVDLSFLPEQAQ